MSEGMSVRAWARSRGIPHSTATRAVASGRVVPGPDGKIDPEAADADFGDNTRHRIDGHAGSGTAGRRGGRDQSTARYRAARAEREELRVQREREALKREREGSVSHDVLHAISFTTARATQQAVVLFRTRMAPRLVQQDLATVRAVLLEETERALDDLRRLVKLQLAKYYKRRDAAQGGHNKKGATNGHG